jgi:hypothetical protein
MFYEIAFPGKPAFVICRMGKSKPKGGTEVKKKRWSWIVSLTYPKKWLWFLPVKLSI